jgi:integrase
VRDIKRPRVNRRQGTTRAFSPKEARAILDAPDATSLRGLRDRAILSVGFQAGPRRSEIASLLVRDFHTNSGYKSLHFIRKGGEDLSLALNPQTSQRIQEYLAASGHGDDLDGPLFRPASGSPLEMRRHLHPEAIDRILRKYATKAGLGAGYSAHSMRATFITTALDKGASLEDVQRDVGHADPGTTKLYDRRGYNPEKSEIAGQAVGGRITRDALSGSLKARRNGNGAQSDATSPARVTALLGAGRSITLSGPGLTLETLITWIEELLAKARKVRPQGLELQTFIKMLKDQAKA